MENKLLHLVETRLNTKIISATSVGGGSINTAYQLQTAIGFFFCKINNALKLPQLFGKEVSGLTTIAAQRVIAVPGIVDCFETEDRQFLILEHIAEGERNTAFWKTFGEELAALHTSSHETYGLTEDNYMGSVPQSNKPSDSWTSFFQQQRLHPMVERCSGKKLLSAKHLQLFDNIAERLPQLFDEEPPGLLHGDLWSGNFMCNCLGKPVLIDPAIYYGHRSADLAMTTLFGGFHPAFYEAYRYHSPLPVNYKEQWQACNLYPLLIHLYLFGSSYLPQIERNLLLFQ